MSDETSKRPGSRGESRAGGDPRRDERGRWLPGASSPNPAGRAPKAQELQHAEAARRGCPPEEFQRVVAKVKELALGGDVQAASLLARIFGLGREGSPTTTAELGFSAAAVFSRPGAVERVDAIMTELFATDAVDPPPGEALPANGEPRGALGT